MKRKKRWENVTANDFRLPDYETVWRCIRRTHGETFPDGFPVPQRQGAGRGWTPSKPIWIKLGEGDSWKQAITFGPNKGNLRKAAKDFNAADVVWPEEVQK